MSHTQVPTRVDRGPASLAVPDPEVVVKAQRRQFNGENKRRILQEADRLPIAASPENTFTGQILR
jgi:hypothetical protein